LDELERAVDTQLQLPVSQLAADRPEASTVAALLLLVPAVTSIASAATLGETLHPATLVGMVVAIVGVGTNAAARVAAEPADLAGQPLPGRLTA
jgi:threonine/homoserine efflux transporter RhtA